MRFPLKTFPGPAPLDRGDRKTHCPLLGGCKRGCFGVVLLLLAGCEPVPSQNVSQTLVETTERGDDAAVARLVQAAGSVQTGERPLPRFATTVRDAILAFAPYKQVATSEMRPDTEIGRTPAAACDSVIFLADYLQYRSDDAAARSKLQELSEWVIDHQAQAQRRIGLPGVASAPDADPPYDTFYYAIDGGLCGDAMLAAAAATGEARYYRSALGFGDFILALGAEHRRRSNEAGIRQSAFCEYVAPAGRGLAFNCAAYVKNGLLLGFLKRLSDVSNDTRYAAAASRARPMIVEGLAGAWEYADEPSPCGTAPCEPIWKRVQGSRAEPDTFVYGDTLAYGLRGLFEYEGASPQVRELYQRLMSFRGRDPRTAAFDPRVAMAGYMKTASWAPDEESAYYDLVTIGILQPIRLSLAPQHSELASRFLSNVISSDGLVPWGVGFEGQDIGIETFDLTTLSVLGRAVLDQRNATR